MTGEGGGTGALWPTTYSACLTSGCAQPHKCPQRGNDHSSPSLGRPLYSPKAEHRHLQFRGVVQAPLVLLCPLCGDVVACSCTCRLCSAHHHHHKGGEPMTAVSTYASPVKSCIRGVTNHIKNHHHKGGAAQRRAHAAAALACAAWRRCGRQLAGLCLRREDT